ncbi:MAG TPA: PaaI family thioesterase [Azospirillum sp.]|nr:PaaI family thioesterase [Azospirillum sp.]
MALDAYAALFPYQTLLGFRVEEWGGDTILLALDAGDQHVDGTGLVDRGVQASLLDAATGLAGCHCAVPGNMRRVVTLSLATQFLAPAAPGPLRASGRIVHRDGKILLAEGRLHGRDGVLLASATARLRYVGGSEHPDGHPETDVRG